MKRIIALVTLAAAICCAGCANDTSDKHVRTFSTAYMEFETSGVDTTFTLNLRFEQFNQYGFVGDCNDQILKVNNGRDAALCLQTLNMVIDSPWITVTCNGMR